MVEKSIITTINKYLQLVIEEGINVKRAVLFGSYAQGKADEWSDIDLVVIAPELDNLQDHHLISKLWELRAFTDSRIEPIPCGEREWESDSGRPILEIAHREGIIIST